MTKEKLSKGERAVITDTAAKFIIESERIQTAKKMEKLKQARLQMEAAMPEPVAAKSTGKRSR